MALDLHNERVKLYNEASGKRTRLLNAVGLTRDLKHAFQYKLKFAIATKLN
jgi:hypothetical protein